MHKHTIPLAIGNNQYINHLLYVIAGTKLQQHKYYLFVNDLPFQVNGIKTKYTFDYVYFIAMFDIPEIGEW